MLDIDITVRHGAFTLRAECRLDAPITGIFGPSGAGKTTLLSALAGLTHGATGRIGLKGETLLDTARRAVLPTHRRGIGVVFQDSRLFPHLSVRGNLLFGHSRRRPRCPAFDDVVEVLHLAPLLDSHPGQLSGGEKRRVALGRAILAGPDLLLLDEPLTGLDDALRRQVLGYLRGIHRAFNLPMLMVSHDMESILALTDRLLLLREGRVAGQGAYMDLVQQSGTLDMLTAREPTSVLDLEVLECRDDLATCRPVLAPGETTAMAAGGRLPAMRIQTPHGAHTGEHLRVSLPSNRIALSPTPVAGISIQNQIAARVIRPLPSHSRRLCLLDCGARLLAPLTEALDAPDARGWCLFRADAARVL